jgi:hypothetical protein
LPVDTRDSHNAQAFVTKRTVRSSQVEGEFMKVESHGKCCFLLGQHKISKYQLSTCSQIWYECFRRTILGNLRRSRDSIANRRTCVFSRKYCRSEHWRFSNPIKNALTALSGRQREVVELSQRRRNPNDVAIFVRLSGRHKSPASRGGNIGRARPRR